MNEIKGDLGNRKGRIVMIKLRKGKKRGKNIIIRIKGVRVFLKFLFSKNKKTKLKFINMIKI